MPINVICRTCHARFTVSEKFAGKKGPCPKCKAVIEIPSLEEQVVIKEPELEAGAKNAAGQMVLKPIERTETVINPLLIAGYAAGAVMFLFMAFVMRNLADKTVMLAVGAIALGPPLAWGGYCMLRDDEDLEPYSGLNLWIRVAIASLCYAILWWAIGFVYGRFFGDEPAEVWNMAVILPVFLFLGAGAAAACFDFELGSGFFHYALYFLVTVVLRMTMGLPVIGPVAAPPVPPEAPTATGPTAVSWLLEFAQPWLC